MFHQGDRRSSGQINDGLVLLEEEDEEGDAQGNEQTVKDNHEATGKRTSTTRNQAETRKSSFPGKIVDACHVVETGNARIPKTRKDWLKDPGLYRVCVCNRRLNLSYRNFLFMFFLGWFQGVSTSGTHTDPDKGVRRIVLVLFRGR